MNIRARMLEGPDDLERMAARVADAWRAHGPHVECAPGDLTWRYYRSMRVHPTENVRLWEDEGGALVAFAWLYPLTGDVDLFVHPREACARVVPAMIEWAEARASEPGALDREGRTITAWTLESNAELTAALEARGLTRTGGCYFHLFRELSGARSAPELPPGYEVRGVAGIEEVSARAAVHRAAFGTERLTDEACRRLMGAPGYRKELDTVVVAPDGTFAAFALAWLDPENGVGALEPVGTRPEERRQGLARAAIQRALLELRAHGARAALVCALKANEGSFELYEALGFRVVDKNLGYARPKPA